MGWLSERDKPRDIPKPVSDTETLGIPEMYLRPELIPVKEPDDTPKTADKYVRWWSRMYAGGARR